MVFFCKGISHQSDFSARVCFCSSLQASLYAAVVDLVLLVCSTLWWAWSLLLKRVCSSWSLGSNQSWCFLSGLTRYAWWLTFPLDKIFYMYNFTFSRRWACHCNVSIAWLTCNIYKGHMRNSPFTRPVYALWVI